ncbi:FtsB family cell division protein [Geomicrobium sediminis]|uniref:Cell division protein DivIC n=1 Tax=Geomicrobium sediminis TaxID=1347788 RepID=A0ABS2PI48_9BACL|nr:septum formation initiator family protein [Geomicrobium sediminis]MBM7635107.1 cell division protein DivIC [Geomicrobium sediminis]
MPKSNDREKVTTIHKDKPFEKEQKRLQMREERRRRGLKRRLIFIGIVGAFVIVFAAVGLISQKSMIDANDQEQEQLEERYAELMEEQKQLEQDIVNYNDIDYIAEVARRDLYLTKPGETIFKVPESHDDQEEEDEEDD